MVNRKNTTSKIKAEIVLTLLRGVDSSWRKMSADYQLNGFNIRASEALIKEIGEKVFKEGQILMSNYFLIDPNAEVLIDKLPRPSQLTQLEEALNKVLIK